MCLSSRRAAPPMDKEYHPASPKCQSERAAVTPLAGAVAIGVLRTPTP